MATNVPNVSIMECSLLRVPSGYFQFTSLDDDTEPGNRTGVCALGSNSIIISEKTWSTLSSSYAKHTRSNHAWCAIVFGLKTEHAIVGSENQSCRRIVQVINNQRVSDNTVVISNDFLFNIFGNTKFSSKIQMERIPVMTLSCESISDNELPPRATKVVLSLLYNDLENYFVDDLLLKYFAYPRYLHSGDVFSVHVDDSHTLQCLNGLNVDTVCFKVSEVQGALTDTQGLFKESGLYLVDSSVAVYQSASNRGFVPPRCVPMLPKPNLWSLLSDERFLKQSFSHYQCLVPLSFDVAFETLRLWTEPFLFNLDQIKGMKLNPLFLVAGQNGSGKSMLVQALTQFLGVAYWRVDCVTVGGGTPGQAEGKIKAIFAQLGSVAPCVLHLANIEALFQDIESKIDTRVVRCFETQVNQLSGRKPVVIVGSTHSIKTISSDVNYLFLDSLSVPAPTCEQREQIIEWLVWSSAGAIDSQVVQAVASQTSGFAFRDLQVLVALAFKGKCKRLQRENDENSNFIVQDFSRVIEVMHKAYSESIGAPKVPSVSWKDVGGLESLKTEILRSLRSNMFSTGLKRSGLLLHGPPGTGKTLLAKAVATQCNRNFLSVKGPELLNMYVGQSEQNVRDLFELAKVASPCIVFFDELDSLAPNRGRSGDSGGVMDRVVSQLLAEMDDLGSSGDVFILGATNRPDLIDPALLRPGRLDKLLYVGPCEDRNAQLSVITALTHKLLMGPDVDLQEIVSLMPKSVSGAQVSALCSAAWLSSARHLISSNKHTQKIDVVIERSHFLSALNFVFNQS